MQNMPTSSTEVIAAMFEDQPAALAAQDALRAVGVPDAAIELVFHVPATDGTLRSQTIWHRIRGAFFEHHHAHVFAEAVERGRCVLFVRIDKDASPIIAALEACHPIDVPHRVAQWRQAGWTGQHAGSDRSPIPLLFAAHEDLDHIPTTGMINEPEIVRPIGAPLTNPMGIEFSGSRQVLRYSLGEAGT
ncbi:MAG: hypothetical protein POG24_06275 [Acidocella sp.]|nr:hypothetical protein [Acidocella sp.]